MCLMTFRLNRKGVVGACSGVLPSLDEECGRLRAAAIVAGHNETLVPEYPGRMGAGDQDARWTVLSTAAGYGRARTGGVDSRAS